MKSLFKFRIVLTLLCLGSLAGANAQDAALMPLYKAGVNFHKSTGFELGLIAYSYFPKGNQFVEMGISTEGVFKSDFLLIPKLNLEGGTAFSQNGLFMLVGGVNLGLPTDFNIVDVAVSPKIGVSYGSFIRVYYSYNFFVNGDFKHHIAQNQIGIEINIATFHSIKMSI